MSGEKKSKALNFRVAESFHAKVQALSAATGQEKSDICRFGMLACWPEIEALVSANTGALPQDPESVREMRDILELCRTAKSRGVDLRQALTDAMETKLCRDAQAAA